MYSCIILGYFAASCCLFTLFQVCFNVELGEEVDQGDDVDACHDDGEGFTTVTQAWHSVLTCQHSCLDTRPQSIFTGLCRVQSGCGAVVGTLCRDLHGNLVAHEQICVAPDPADEELCKLKLRQSTFEADGNRNAQCLNRKVCVLEGRPGMIC